MEPWIKQRLRRCKDDLLFKWVKQQEKLEKKWGLKIWSTLNYHHLLNFSKKITKLLYCPPIKTKIFYSLISHVPVPSQNYFLHSKLHLKQLQMMMMLMLAEMQHSQRCEERRWEEMSASAAPNICHVKINVFFLTPRS